MGSIISSTYWIVVSPSSMIPWYRSWFTCSYCVYRLVRMMERRKSKLCLQLHEHMIWFVRRSRPSVWFISFISLLMTSQANHQRKDLLCLYIMFSSDYWKATVANVCVISLQIFDAWFVVFSLIGCSWDKKIWVYIFITAACRSWVIHSPIVSGWVKTCTLQ